jgi:hypothetical protein
MRAQEFIREDTFTPAQQAAQRAGMGTKAWVGGPPPSPPPSIAKKLATKTWKALPYVGAAMSVDDAIDRWKAGDHTGAVISTLAAVGYIVPGPMGWVVAGGLEMANSQRDAGLVPDIAPGKDYVPTQKKMKQPWDHPPINEESASDINPNTGKPYTTDEWARYWNPGAGRPYTEKEKEMFANPDVTAKSVGKEVLRRIPGIGALINIGDAVQGFKDLSR